MTATTSTARDERTIGSGPRAGDRFKVEVPTHWALMLEFAEGASAQSTFSFQSALARPGMFEVTGTEGTLVLPDPNYFEGDCLLWTLESWRGVTGHDVPEPERIPAQGATASRGLGLLDLVRSARTGTAERASGELASHVLDVMLAADRAAKQHAPVAVTSRIDKPEPLPADWDPTERTLA